MEDISTLWPERSAGVTNWHHVWDALWSRPPSVQRRTLNYILKTTGSQRDSKIGVIWSGLCAWNWYRSVLEVGIFFFFFVWKTRKHIQKNCNNLIKKKMQDFIFIFFYRTTERHKCVAVSWVVQHLNVGLKRQIRRAKCQAKVLWAKQSKPSDFWHIASKDDLKPNANRRNGDKQ